MAMQVFFLSKLREGVDPADYEHWVRSFAYPFAKQYPTIRSYVVTRIAADIEGGEPPHDIVETLEITDYEAWLAEVSPDKPEVRAFDEQWQSYVGDTVAVYGETIE